MAELVWKRLGFVESEESDADDSELEEKMNKRIDQIAEEQVVKKYHEEIEPHSKNSIVDFMNKEMIEVVNQVRKLQRENKYHDNEHRSILNKYNRKMLEGTVDNRNMLDPLSHD